jgi:predicted nucleic acid-binding protein
VVEQEPLALEAAGVSGATSGVTVRGAEEIRRSGDLIDRYSDQAIGLADASLIVLAGRDKTIPVLTLDHRRFRVLRAPAGGPFTVLP